MSIMPGMENFAPERTDTSNGSSGSPSRRPMRSSSLVRCPAISPSSSSGHPSDMYARQASVEIVKPCGTGRPSTEVISAKLAPFPPRRSLSSIGARGCAWSKSYT